MCHSKIWNWSVQSAIFLSDLQILHFLGFGKASSNFKQNKKWNCMEVRRTTWAVIRQEMWRKFIYIKSYNQRYIEMNNFLCWNWEKLKHITSCRHSEQNIFWRQIPRKHSHISSSKIETLFEILVEHITSYHRISSNYLPTFLPDFIGSPGLQGRSN